MGNGLPRSFFLLCPSSGIILPEVRKAASTASFRLNPKQMVLGNINQRWNVSHDAAFPYDKRGPAVGKYDHRRVFKKDLIRLAVDVYPSDSIQLYGRGIQQCIQGFVLISKVPSGMGAV